MSTPDTGRPNGSPTIEERRAIRERDSRKKRRRNAIIAAISLVVAVLATLTGIFGYRASHNQTIASESQEVAGSYQQQAAQANERAASANLDAANANKAAALAKLTAQSAVSVVQTLKSGQSQNSGALQSASAQLQSYGSAQSSLQSVLSQLNAQNKALSSSLAQTSASSSLTALTTPAAPAGDGTVRYTGPLSLYSYESSGADLDDLGTKTVRSPDIVYLEGDVLAVQFTASMKLLNAGDPINGSVALCGDKGYSSDNIDTTTLQKGSAICVLTGDHRLAVLQYVAPLVFGVQFTVTTFNS